MTYTINLDAVDDRIKCWDNFTDTCWIEYLESELADTVEWVVYAVDRAKEQNVTFIPWLSDKQDASITFETEKDFLLFKLKWS